jgi:alpha-beta hydrolase superfamily lysophospholipase
MTGHDFDASDDPVGRAVESSRSMRAMAQRSTVVLVHGAWHGAWCWDEVVSRLSADGLRVVTVELPSVTSGGDLYDDARAVRQVLDDTPGDQVLVGHSYGGIVVTEAAAGADGVRHLVYLTAFMLDEGQALADVAGRTPPAWQIPDPDGRTLSVEGAQGGLLQHVHAADRRRRRRASAPADDRLVRAAGALGRLARPALDLRHLRARQRHPGPGARGDGRARGQDAPPAQRPLAVPHRPRRRRRPHPRGRIAVHRAEERAGAADHRVVTSVCHGPLLLAMPTGARPW